MSFFIISLWTSKFNAEFVSMWIIAVALVFIILKEKYNFQKKDKKNWTWLFVVQSKEFKFRSTTKRSDFWTWLHLSMRYFILLVNVYWLPLEICKCTMKWYSSDFSLLFWQKNFLYVCRNCLVSKVH